jgi:hypothetical protein
MIAASSGPSTSPRPIAAPKIRIFAQNPAAGGTPARDTMNSVIPTARNGATRATPAKSEIRSRGLRLLSATATAKAPRFMIP